MLLEEVVVAVVLFKVFLSFLASVWDKSSVSIFSSKWGLDLRSIALFRMGLALLYLWNLYDRSSEGKLKLFFPSDGLLPPHLYSSPFGLSLLDGLSYPTAIAFMGLAAVFGVFLLVGFLTSVSRWVCFAVLVLLAHRFTPFMEGAHLAFHLVFLFGCLLPLGDRFSVDSCRRAKGADSFLGGIGQQLQMSLPVVYMCLTLSVMYFLNWHAKSLHDLWWDGRAFQWVVQDTVYSVRPLGVFFKELLGVTGPYVSTSSEGVPPIYILMSRGIIFTELFLSASILLSLRFSFFRFMTFLLVFAFHMGIFLFMNVAPFSKTILVCSLLFIPSFFYRTPSSCSPFFYRPLRRPVFYGGSWAPQLFFLLSFLF